MPLFYNLLDFIWPRSRGGSDDLANLQAAPLAFRSAGGGRDEADHDPNSLAITLVNIYINSCSMSGAEVQPKPSPEVLRDQAA